MVRSHFTLLQDSQQHLPADSELILVEGDSAAKSVCRCRDTSTQAVLAMQGKPLNTTGASRRKIKANQWLMSLVDALGTGFGATFELERLRYRRIMMLFDPDADGIHCGALMMFFFHTWMRPLLDAGCIQIARPPLYQIMLRESSDPVLVYSGDHYHRILAAISERGLTVISKQHFRGLASINPDMLRSTCLNPSTRVVDPVTTRDAADAIQIFAPRFSRPAQTPGTAHPHRQENRR